MLWGAADERFLSLCLTAVCIHTAKLPRRFTYANAKLEVTSFSQAQSKMLFPTVDRMSQALQPLRFKRLG